MNDRALFAGAKIRHVRNPAARARRPPRAEKILPDAALDEAAREISQWPGYASAPLVSLPGLARECGIAAAHYKDESGRFNLGSFKALGGPFALRRALREGAAKGASVADTVAVAATDGNHGRALAWGAQRFGCGCAIFIHQGVSENRADAMRALGAQVIRVSGDYDESLRRARDESAKPGRVLISDFSDDPLDKVTRDVMAGYALLSAEARAGLSPPPTHVLLPAGVGGLAAAVIADFWRANPESRPRFAVVESDRADCLLQSAASGARTTVSVRRETVMAGLSCGEVSAPAWEIVSRGADDFVAIPDELVAPAMRRAASGENGDPALTAGECAAAGWAVLLAAAARPELFRGLALGRESRVLLIGTEGATDPEIYRRIIGGAAR